MTSREMKQDLKFKVNKTDSKQNRNFLVPEIDWVLNEAIELYIQLVLHPKKAREFGWEEGKRTIEDINTLLKVSSLEKTDGNKFKLPDDIYYPLDAFSKAIISNGICDNQQANFELIKLSDYDVNNPDTHSSFDWRIIRGYRFDADTIKIIEESGLSVKSLEFYYIKKPAFVHNAGDFRGGTYTNLKGDVLTGYQDCDLPEHTHREICDIAAMLLTQQQLNPDLQSQIYKLNMNQLNNN